MSKQFYFEQFSLVEEQFQCQKQFFFKQFTLAYVRSLQLKTVVFQVLQFNISTRFSSI